MAWFEKALKSVQDTAGKAAFEADKLVRVNRETSVLSELQNKTQSKLADLGKAALELYRNGALSDPAVAVLAAELAELEAQVRQQKDKVEAIHGEQFQPEPQGAPAPVAPPAAEPDTHAEATAPEPAPAPEMVECPNCHTQVKPTATFCPECGNRLR
jgi:hypothetical protein